jgi:hypothetical protein
MDLFSILATQEHSNVEYFPSRLFCLYRNYHDQQRFDEQLVGRNIRRSGRHREMIQCNIWISMINQNSHWQTLVIINPGKPFCTAFLMDSLIHSTDDHSSNFQLVNSFAVRLVNEVCQHNNMPECCSTNLLRQCLVPIQPNGYDCGPFTLLNIKNTVGNMALLLTMTTDELCKALKGWYIASKALEYRKYLSWRYVSLMQNYRSA